MSNTTIPDPRHQVQQLAHAIRFAIPQLNIIRRLVAQYDTATAENIGNLIGDFHDALEGVDQ